MSSVSPSSGATSAPTSEPSRNGEKPLPGEAVAAAGSPGGDAYLREQADAARAALAQGITDLKAALAGTVDPRQLPRRYPFLTIGGVAVAGFVAAVLTIPSREQQELKRLERIRRAMYPDPEPVKAKEPAVESAAEKAAAVPFWMMLLREGIQAARPLLVSLVTASLKARQQAAAEPPPEPEPPYGG